MVAGFSLPVTKPVFGQQFDVLKPFHAFVKISVGNYVSNGASVVDPQFVAVNGQREQRVQLARDIDGKRGRVISIGARNE